jgi:4-hydroxybutyryl-CoA dehydratase/vinylacetyl-CoA-Delta-isomerase
VVEERKDGIIVRGAKTHISQAPLCNEILIAPCRAMKEEDKAYALSFAVPVNTKGVTLISAEPEVHEANFFDHPIAGSVYINDATIIFEDVFVPKERIFLKGEWNFAGEVAYMFANFHRLSAETYKAMELELFTGAALLMAEYNGVEKAPHIRDKLTWLVMFTEAVEVIGRSACEYCITEPDSDLVYPNPLYANICKFYFADNWHQATNIFRTLAAGLPSLVLRREYSIEIHDLLDKYIRRTSTEHRMRMAKLIRPTSSRIATVHAEGRLKPRNFHLRIG